MMTNALQAWLLRMGVKRNSDTDERQHRLPSFVED